MGETVEGTQAQRSDLNSRSHSKEQKQLGLDARMYGEACGEQGTRPEAHGQGGAGLLQELQEAVPARSLGPQACGESPGAEDMSTAVGRGLTELLPRPDFAGKATSVDFCTRAPDF
jgi:hypothetical protein